MRSIDFDRIGEYLKTAVDIIAEHNGEYPTRLLVSEMEKRLKPQDYELSKSKSGGVRWVTKFRFWTIGLVKGGYIKKHQKVWYLTDKGKLLVGKPTDQFWRISKQSYEEWRDSEKQEEPDDESYEDGSEFPSEIVSPPPGNMEIKPSPLTFDELLTGVDRGTVLIPPFQRSFVWKAKEIVFLLDSIYRGYPIGSFIFWRTSKRLPHHKQIGGLELQEPPIGSTINYVLDGQQRITSLYAAVRGAEIEDTKLNFYFDLSIGRFSYDSKEDEDEGARSQTVIPLSKIFVKGPEYHKYMRTFPEQYQDVLEDLFFRFNNYSFSAIYVEEKAEAKNGNDDIKKIVNIFSRINETGRKLTVVAEMVARCWGEGFLLREKLDELQNQHPELKDISEEAILQTCSIILNNKRCHKRNILEDTNIAELQKEWDQIIVSLFRALDFTKDRIRIKNLKYLPFDALLVPLAYFHYKTPNPTNDQVIQLSEWFWTACLSSRFGSSVESKIEADCNTFDQLLSGQHIDLGYSVDWDNFRTNLIDQDYSLKNAFSKTVFCLYAYHQPKSLKDNRDVDLVNSFSGYSRNNLHHFFPRGYLEKIDDPEQEYKESVVNIAFAPAIVNLEMSDRAPSEYIKEFSASNQDIKETLKSHLIGDPKEFGIVDNNFALFLERRAEAIENEFRSLMGLRSKTEEQFEEEPSAPISLLEARLIDLINNRLIKLSGNDYWNSAIPEDIRAAVSRKVAEEVRSHPYERERYKIPLELLKFLDIMDYFKIISSNWKSFEDLFGSRSELERHFLSLKKYRNEVKHPRGLNPVDKRNGEAAILWFENIFK